MSSTAAVLFSVSCGGTLLITLVYKWKYKYIPTENRRRVLYNHQAAVYDKTVNRYEWVYGIKNWRKTLIPEAKGHVLEIGAGTCRNLEYLDKSKVKSITCVDFSRPMLREGVKKQSTIKDQIPIKLLCYNIVRLPFPDDSFDTLIDTYGLCSYELPVESLKEALRCIKVGGQILLLEHGISGWPFLRAFQEGFIERHASIWGCFNTRHIEAILNLCDIKIITIKKKRFGTYLLIHGEKIAPKITENATT